MNTPMSTPVSQLKNVANSQAPPKIDDDPMVQDIINSLVNEVKSPDNVKSSPIGSFQQQMPQQQMPQQHMPQQQMPQQQMHQQQMPQQQMPQQQMPQQQMLQQQMHQQYMPQQPQKQIKKSFMEEWVNVDDAKTALIIAFIALVLLYPMDTTSLYSKFDALNKFHQYDIFIRAMLLAFLLYIIFRKFKHLI
jgi:hypothetical protein